MIAEYERTITAISLVHYQAIDAYGITIRTRNFIFNHGSPPHNVSIHRHFQAMRLFSLLSQSRPHSHLTIRILFRVTLKRLYEPIHCLTVRLKPRCDDFDTVRIANPILSSKYAIHNVVSFLHFSSVLNMVKASPTQAEKSTE